MVKRVIPQNDNLEKLARDAQKLASKKEKQNWKFNNCWFDKKRKLWFRPNNNQVLPDTKVPNPHHCTCIKPLAY